MVVFAGGEPLLHKELPEIVRGAIERGKFVTVCTNALLLEKKIDQYEPSDAFNWSVHLDGDKEAHDKSVCQKGVYERAVDAIKLAKSKGFRVNINCTLFNDAEPERVAEFFDTVKELGVGGITVSPGYAYERAPDQQHFLNREKTKSCSATSFVGAMAARSGRSSSRRCSSTSSPATRPITARHGAIPRAPCSAGSGPAICSAKATPKPIRS